MFNGLLGVLLVGTLRWNAEIWVNDYPPDIKEKFGPISPKAKKQATLVAIPFFFIMIGGIIWSNLKLKQKNEGQLSISAAFTNAFALIFTGWFFDLTLLDLLMFVRHTPDWVILPGTEDMAGYDDYMFHLKARTKALPMLTQLLLSYWHCSQCLDHIS